MDKIREHTVEMLWMIIEHNVKTQKRAPHVNKWLNKLVLQMELEDV